MEEKILLLVTYEVKPGERENLVNAVTEAGILGKIREEDGCISYQYYFDSTDANRILLVEKWKSEAKQQEHLKTTHMKAFKEIKEQYVLNTTVEKVKF